MKTNVCPRVLCPEAGLDIIVSSPFSRTMSTIVLFRNYQVLKIDNTIMIAYLSS